MAKEYKLSFPAADINRRLEKVDSLIQTINSQAPDDNGNFDGLATTDYVDTSITNILLAIYPVGAIYLSVNDTSPASLFGGTWERIEDTFLLGAGATYTAGSTGGEATHTLTIDEMPAHNHGLERSIDDGQTWREALPGTDGYYDKDYYFSGGQKLMPHTDWNIRIAYTGGDQAHNNMPPYLTVYMWKRVE